MKKSKRYSTEAQILTDIDRAHERIRGQLSKAESLEASSVSLLRCGSPDMIESAKMKQSEADKLRRNTNLIIDRTLPHLKQKLAEFKTMTLPGVVSDSSIKA